MEILNSNIYKGHSLYPIMNKLMKICDCGEIIRGSSVSQLIYNYNSHKKGKKHKERFRLIEKYKNNEEVVYFENEDIKEKLANHPVMIEDIKQIGRVIG